MVYMFFPNVFYAFLNDLHAFPNEFYALPNDLYAFLNDFNRFRYILYYSPAIYIIDGKEFSSLEEYRKYFNISSSKEDELDNSSPYYGGIKVPTNDYGSSQVSIILVMFAFFADSFAIGGIYIKYKGK